MTESNRCGYCGAFLSKVPVTQRTDVDDIEAVNLICRNPRCPEAKRRASQNMREDEV